MIVIEDGRKSFTQWDKGIYVLIDEGCDSIDVSRSDKKVSRNVKVQKAGSVFRAAVPDALLTEAGYLNISCIAEEKDGNRTISTYRFRITPRAKPENYAFGHEELGSWKALLLRMNALERAAREGRFDGSPGVGIQAVEPYLTAEMSGFENVYHVILTNGQIFELRVHNGRDGKAGADGEPGADGNGISRIELVSQSTESGGQSIYRIFYSDGGTFDYTVYNGKDGEKGASISSVTIEKMEEQSEADPFVTKSYVMRIIESDESTVRYNAPQEKTEEERMIAQYNVGILNSISGVAKTKNEDFKINILDGLQIRQNAGTVYLLGKKYEFKGEVRTFANSTSGRRTAMFFRLNKTDNSIIGYWKGCKTDVAEIVTISGSETLPVRNDQYFDVVIAYVDIPANATVLTDDMIHDLRGDPAYCGYVEYVIGGGSGGGGGETYAPMTGATADTDGSAGLVPQPKAGEHGKFLRGDGTWAEADKTLTKDGYAADAKVVGEKISELSVKIADGVSWNELKDKPFYLNKTLFIALTKDDFTVSDKDGIVKYLYRSTPKLDWITSLESVALEIEIVDINGKRYTATQDSIDINFEKDTTDDDYEYWICYSDYSMFEIVSGVDLDFYDDKYYYKDEWGILVGDGRELSEINVKIYSVDVKKIPEICLDAAIGKTKITVGGLLNESEYEIGPRVIVPDLLIPISPNGRQDEEIYYDRVLERLKIVGNLFPYKGKINYRFSLKTPISVGESISFDISSEGDTLWDKVGYYSSWQGSFLLFDLASNYSGGGTMQFLAFRDAYVKFCAVAASNIGKLYTVTFEYINNYKTLNVTIKCIV